jgi:hypothetical protein
MVFTSKCEEVSKANICEVNHEAVKTKNGALFNGKIISELVIAGSRT